MLLCNYQTDNKYLMMDKNYIVGDLIFDAAIYDGLNTFLDDLEFYKKWLPKDKEARILELCCGTGRLTIPIAKEGYNITGVDYTTSMLNQAIAKANKEHLSIDFVEKDIRTLDLGKKFDFIFIPFNSIHHLYKNEDLFKVLKMVKKHLQENGIFLLDCFNPDILFLGSRHGVISACGFSRSGTGISYSFGSGSCYNIRCCSVAWRTIASVKSCKA